MIRGRRIRDEVNASVGRRAPIRIPVGHPDLIVAFESYFTRRLAGRPGTFKA